MEENGKKEASMSIAERRAAWRGLDRPIPPPRVSTASFRTNGASSLLPSPAAAVRSPCFVIPPGLSPAALLDSPVLLQVPSDNPVDRVMPLVGCSHENLSEASIPERSNIDLVELESERVDDSCDKASDKDQSSSTATALNKSLEDGYNWRKYGQKHVKGCEFPRNYYKCTYPNCNVKKMVEQSANGQISDVVYKGNHDHGLPEAAGSKGCNQKGYLGKRSGDSRVSHLEVSSSASAVTEISDHTSVSGKDSSTLGESVSCGNPNDVLLPRSVLCDNNNDIDAETELKRRKSEDYLIDALPASQAAREPRVVVQTVSEIDLLDDGYRWRKYGQKVVKGNPNPRSYYKCTSPGCPVRKHVERAPHDLKSVITTYEGKHNHEVPINNSSNFKGQGDNGTNSNISGSQMSMQPHNVTNVFESIQDSYNRAIGEACLGTSNLNVLQNMPFETYVEFLRHLNPEFSGLAKYTGN
ncbi:hypothetical protein LUZ61_001092 [Rhynchospora tenuis]|uniref:WRKY domain-containing protein n=1 Tax=Rhynchospora tenuis TaxID=198213 RepID=A0AAD5ZGA1_9POAL|nr:hypothetical protein LUZ61_001092 [Rhynchospora tenuis]